MTALLILARAGTLETLPLQIQLERLANGFDGRVGICVQDQRTSVCVSMEASGFRSRVS